jgi:hypothetical protein
VLSLSQSQRQQSILLLLVAEVAADPTQVVVARVEALPLGQIFQWHQAKSSLSRMALAALSQLQVRARLSLSEKQFIRLAGEPAAQLMWVVAPVPRRVQ